MTFYCNFWYIWICISLLFYTFYSLQLVLGRIQGVPQDSRPGEHTVRNREAISFPGESGASLAREFFSMSPHSQSGLPFHGAPAALPPRAGLSPGRPLGLPRGTCQPGAVSLGPALLPWCRPILAGAASLALGRGALSNPFSLGSGKSLTVQTQMASCSSPRGRGWCFSLPQLHCLLICALGVAGFVALFPFGCGSCSVLEKGPGEAVCSTCIGRHSSPATHPHEQSFVSLPHGILVKEYRGEPTGGCKLPLALWLLWVFYSCISPHSALGNLKLLAEFFSAILPMGSPVFFLCFDPGMSKLTSCLSWQARLYS